MFGSVGISTPYIRPMISETTMWIAMPTTSSVGRNCSSSAMFIASTYGQHHAGEQIDRPPDAVAAEVAVGERGQRHHQPADDARP